ncbi:MAG: OB-fold domain-containing protein [Chloroflexi bacterium]|nr:OB-fold domain-containing protein [Chloroflexota bacterium]
MVGIVAYGAYVPLSRLGPGTNGWSYRTERAVASYDEDSITMAVAAAINCLGSRDRDQIDALYFASTSSPYVEKQGATLVATAADLRRQVFTADMTNSLRAATIALKTATDSVKAGSARQALVAAADLRLAQPRSGFEPVVGDGAAALVIGDSDVAVEIVDSYSVSDELLDVWRSEGDRFIRSWEDRFILEEGYLKIVPEVVGTLLSRNKLSAKDFARAVFYAPESRRHGEMARMLGFDVKTQVQDPMAFTLGNSGAAYTLMMLTAALDAAKPGDRILLANYGNGADAFILQVTDKIDKARASHSIDSYLNTKRVMEDYQTYARWRGLLDMAPAARRPPLEVPSAVAIWRERDQNLRLHGVRCQSCGYPQFPRQRVCTRCHTKDQFEPVRFSDKGAILFTYSFDYLGPTLEPPLVISVINFDGGGRMVAEMTDRDLKQVKINMPLEMTFRRLHTVDGIHNYYWKCMPVRA